jgi:hypothetical protein
MPTHKPNKKSASNSPVPTTQAPTAAPTTTTSTAGQPAPAPQATQAPTPTVTTVTDSNPKVAKAAAQTSYISLIAGLRAVYPPGAILQLPMGDLTCDEVVADLQAFVQAAEDTKTAYAAWRSAVENEQGVYAQAQPVKSATVGVIRSRFGRTSTKLLQFGIQPSKVQPRTVASKTEAVVKGKATRTARGTKGSKQKLEVSGNVTGVEITPITAGPSVPVTPVTTPAPTAATPAPQPGAAATPVAKS